MFYPQKALLNLWRRKLKSALVILVCALIVLFLFLYVGGLQANLKQLWELPDATPVYARVSNLNGTISSGTLLIKESIIDGLKNSPHVSELTYTAQLGTALGRIEKSDISSMEIGDLTFPLSLGVNKLEAFSSLPAKNIQFLDGIGPAFLEGDEARCIVRERELEENHLAIGDSVDMTLFYPMYPSDRYDLTYQWLGVFRVRIVGSFNEAWDSAQEGPSAEIIFPSKWLEKLHRQANVMFFADSAKFRIADPLELNAFKAEMDELGLMSVISQAQHSHRGNALTVNDEIFVKAASRLLDNINLMWIFMPFICIVVGLVGFVISYLLLHNRKPEIAVMRSLGMSSKSCFQLLFLENALLDISGSVLGLLVSALFIQIGAVLALIATVLFFVCYMAGTAVALKLLGKFSVMAVLSALE